MLASPMALKKQIWSMVCVLAILALMFSFAPASPIQAQVQVVSPEINPDGTVTFRYFNPDASQVQLYIEIGKNDLGYMCYSPTGWPLLDMVKDEDGIWSITVPPMDPDVYNYHFNILVPPATRFTSIIDPSNPTWNPAGINSQLYVPGPGAEWDSIQNVPHGRLQEVFYFSTVTNSQRPLAVYTPPDYDTNERTYPTLYLSHGAGGNHIDWTTQGVANNIIDNLIAQHKIRPMVVVMTNFNGIPGGTEGYRLDLINSVVPAVEAMYRVNKNPDQRAFAGLSMGAIYASNILMKSPEAFGFYGIWSGSFFSANDPGFANPLVYDRRGIFISIGARDFLYQWSMAGMAVLDANHVPYQDLIIPGDCHTWFFWRESLYDFLTTMAFKVN